MEITFRQSWDDWRAYERLVKKFDWLLWGGIVLWSATALYDLATDANLTALLRQGDALAALRTAWSAFAPLVGWLAFLWVLHIVHQWALKRDITSKAPIIVRADRAGIASTFFNKGEPIAWSDVRALEETTAHLFVLNRAKVGIVVPKRAFASQVEAARFVGYVRAQTAKAQPDKPPIARP